MPWNQGFKANIWLFLTGWAGEDHFLLADDADDYGDEQQDMETDEGVARAMRKLNTKGKPAVAGPGEVPVVRPVRVPVVNVVKPGDVTKLPTARVIGMQKPGGGMEPVPGDAAKAIPAAGPTVGGATTAKKRGGKAKSGSAE